MFCAYLINLWSQACTGLQDTMQKHTKSQSIIQKDIFKNNLHDREVIIIIIENSFWAAFVVILLKSQQKKGFIFLNIWLLNYMECKRKYEKKYIIRKLLILMNQVFKLLYIKWPKSNYIHGSKVSYHLSFSK